MEANGHTNRRLYKSRRNKVIDGVCGGIAEYFDVDPTIVRLLWVLVTFMGGSGFILYIVGMIIMPVNPEHLATKANQVQPVSNGTDKKRFFGVMLILAGAFFLLLNIGWFWGFSWWSFSRSVLLPVLLISLGAFFIYMQTSKRKNAAPPVSENKTEVNSESFVERQKELRRSRTNRKLFGVCSGLAKYFDFDPTLMRFIFVALIFISFGWGLLIYIILGIIMPEEKLTETSA
jgi:phage shock protein C